jgi:hypothetical protein
MIHGFTRGFHAAAAFCCSGVTGDALAAGSAVAVAKNSPGKKLEFAQRDFARGDLYMVKMHAGVAGMIFLQI